MESEVWGVDWSWLAGDLRDRIESAPENIVVLVAEAADEVVSAAWLVIIPGTEFAALWVARPCCNGAGRASTVRWSPVAHSWPPTGA
ncbi:hypothetical protein NKG94_22780 [Micromonospora sp. M12]